MTNELKESSYGEEDVYQRGIYLFLLWFLL